MVLAVGCSGHVSVFVSKGKVDPSAEARYREVWKRHSDALAPLLQRLPPVCNVGGTKQGCYDTSAQVVAAYRTFLSDLQATPVPSRYKQADGTLRNAIQTLVAGFERRNQGIARGDDNDFVGGNDQIRAGVSLLNQAYAEFPSDAKPQPPPSG
jgi:hypothetical protein